MAIAFSIFFVGTLFALIYLYNVTKDRWDWTKLAKLISNIVPITIASLFLLLVLGWFSERAIRNLEDYLLMIFAISIELFVIRRLTYDRWNWKKITKYILYVITFLVILLFGFFLNEKLTNIYNNHQADARIKREEAARECNAKEISRIEPKLKAVFSSVSAFTYISQISEIFKQLEPNSLEVNLSEENIKSKIAIAEIKSKCDSESKYRVVATFNESGFLDDYKTIAINPPIGYLSGFVPSNKMKLSDVLELENQETSESKQIFKQANDYYHEKVIRQFSINFVKLEQIKQNTEAEKQKKKVNPFNQFDGQLQDPCAPNLSRTERLKRLEKFGKIRELEDGEYHAGGHMVKYFPASAGGGFWECR